MSKTRIKLRSFPEGTLLSLVALALNSFASMIGASGIGKGLTTVAYTGVLIFTGCLLLCYLLGKYLFLYATNKWKPCCRRFPKKPSNLGCVETLEHYSEKICRKHVAYDLFNCFMIFCYLVGDNLKQMACISECGPCPTIAQFFTGISLILNVTLILLREGGLSKGSLASAYPTIGVRGDAYNKMFQVAAKALVIDQALTAILEHISTSECAKNTVNNNIIVQIGITIAYFGFITLIILVVLMFLVWGQRKTFCPHGCGKNLQKCCETCAQWYFAFSILVFCALFMVADIDWFWDLWKDSPYFSSGAKTARISLLGISFLYCLSLIVLYICVIGIPGLGVVLKKKQFFLLEHRAHGELSTSKSMMRKVDNTWKSDEEASSVPTQQMTNTAKKEKVDTNSTDANGDKCKLKKSVKVNDDVGEAAISFTFKEEITCCQGFKSFWKEIRRWNIPDEGEESHWIMEANVHEKAGRPPTGNNETTVRINTSFKEQNQGTEMQSLGMNSVQSTAGEVVIVVSGK